MGLTWVHENPSHWDEHKQAIVGDAPAGTFKMPSHVSGALIPGEWWRVEDDGRVVGYGWMDHSWGDAEVTLAVRADCRGRGIGTFILDHLEREALAQGLNYLYNVVPPKHPDAGQVTRWLEQRGFRESSDGLLKRHVPPRAAS